jgi:hypothetical protein
MARGVHAFRPVPVYLAPALRIAIALLIPTLAACGAEPPPPRAPVAAPVAHPGARHPIEGVWRLVQFDSRDPLEPPLDGFVAGELGHLEVWLSTGRLFASGELVDTACEYHIEQYDGREFALRLTSENALWSTVSGRIEGDELYFDALDVPWVGSGRFTRHGP